MRCSSCLLCAAVVLLFASPALPFCLVPQPRLVCAEYFRSQLVVKATLVQTNTLHDKDDPDGIRAYVYTVQVNQVIRGAPKGDCKCTKGMTAAVRQSIASPTGNTCYFYFTSQIKRLGHVPS